MSVKIPKNPKKFPTRDQMRAVRIFNSYEIASLREDRIHIDTAEGRGVYQVFREEPTDPEAPWYNYGCKTFRSMRQGPNPTPADALAAAMKWAEEKYGARTWVRDPWGAWQDAEKLPLVWAKVAAGQGVGNG